MQRFIITAFITLGYLLFVSALSSPVVAQDNNDIAFSPYQCMEDLESGSLILRSVVNEDDGDIPDNDEFDIIINANNTVITPDFRPSQIVPRQPTDFVIVLDTTSSMPLDEVKEVLKQNFLSALTDSDRVAILPFGTAINPVSDFLAPSSIEFVLDGIERDATSAEGEQGNVIYDAFNRATQSFNDPMKRKAVLLITDSGPNDTQQAFGLSPSIQSANDQAIQFYVMSFRSNLQAAGPEPLEFDMLRLAESTEGYAWVVPDALTREELPPILATNLTRLIEITRSEVETRITGTALPDGFVITLSLQLDLDEEFNSAEIDCNISADFRDSLATANTPEEAPTNAEVAAVDPSPQPVDAQPVDTQPTDNQPTAIPTPVIEDTTPRTIQFFELPDRLSPNQPISVLVSPVITGDRVQLKDGVNSSWVEQAPVIDDDGDGIAITRIIYDWPNIAPGPQNIELVLVDANSVERASTGVTNIILERALVVRINEIPLDTINTSLPLENNLVISGSFDSPMSLDNQIIQASILVVERIGASPPEEILPLPITVNTDGTFEASFSNFQTRVNSARADLSSNLSLIIEIWDERPTQDGSRNILARTRPIPFSVVPVTTRNFMLPIITMILLIPLSIWLILQIRLARADYIVHHVDIHDLSRPPMKVTFSSQGNAQNMRYGLMNDKVLDKKTLSIGRESFCDLVIPQNHATVARVQGFLIWRNQSWHYVNCRKPDDNVVKINGKPVRDLLLHKLRLHDELNFDGFTMTVETTHASEPNHF